MKSIGVVGGSGYGGRELLRLLAGHPAARVAAVAARSLAGQQAAEVWPDLDVAGEILTPDADALGECDLVFLATPHAASLQLGPRLRAAGAAVVDLSGAFRLPADVFTTWYGDEHPAPALTPAVYGLPELHRDAIAAAGLVANPGCYPTAALLALAPLAELVEADGVVVTGLSGTSGAGAGLRDDLHASHAIGNVAPYGAPRHRHTPEISGQWAALTGQPAPVSFVPHLVPTVRGLVATVSARLRPGLHADDVRAAAEKRYADEAFVRVLPAGEWPHTTHRTGGNGATVGLAVDRDAGRALASCAIDNLVKGAAGQAVQNANLMLGLPEACGLTAAGAYP